MRHYTSLLVIAVSLMATSAACSSGDTTSTVEEDAVVGTYILSTLAGKSLPAVLQSTATTKREVLAATIHLNASRKCSADFTYRDTFNGTATTHDEVNPCTYIVRGTALTMTLTKAKAEQIGFIENERIRVFDPNGEWMFLKAMPID
jgi:hypothetical protein